MKCDYIKELLSENFIQEYENKAQVKLPQDFCEFIKLNNGGRPERELYDTYRMKERGIKKFLSFNKDDKESVWMALSLDNNFVGHYAPFAIDNYGNWLVFSKKGKVVFYNHEDETIELVANSFSEFLQKLY